MKQETVKRVVIWLKRFLGFTAAVLSAVILFTLINSPASFIEESPYATSSMMLIFVVLSLSYKGVEYWEKNLS